MDGSRDGDGDVSWCAMGMGTGTAALVVSGGQGVTVAASRRTQWRKPAPRTAGVGTWREEALGEAAEPAASGCCKGEDPAKENLQPASDHAMLSCLALDDSNRMEPGGLVIPQMGGLVIPQMKAGWAGTWSVELSGALTTVIDFGKRS